MTVDTLIGRIERAAERGRSARFYAGDDSEVVGYDQLLADARRFAAGLQAHGVRPGDHVALLGTTSRSMVTAIEATLIAGAAVVALPLPMRLGSLDEFAAQTRARVLAADSRVLVVDDEFAPFIRSEPGDPPMVTMSDLTAASEAAYIRPVEDPASLAIIQFTSGSTSEPKGVMLPHAQVTANLDAIAEGAEISDGDVVVSWLPLYHDMGLIGILLSCLAGGHDLVIGPPTDFLAKPSRWMRWMSEHGGTHTAGPNFSYVLASRALRRSEEPLDLSRWRMGLNGAEPIDPADVETFIEAGRPHGLRPGVAFCAFGMAEATLAVTFPKLMSGLEWDTVDRTTLEAERYAAPADPASPHARRFAKCGTPVKNMAIRIVGDDGREMIDREVGELQIRGASVTPGYYNNPIATAETFDGDWLRTGDLAYVVDGQLVICGRIKDVIIVGGRNVLPQDIERAVAGIDQIRTGNVIAFGADRGDGRESVVVVAETKAAESLALVEEVKDAARQAVGVPARDVVLVPPGTLPKTSSGKLQRALCRRRYLDGELPVGVS